MNTNEKSFNQKYMLEGFDFDGIDFLDMLCHFDQGVLMTDHEGTLIYYNDIQATIDKLDPADVLGKKITEVYSYNNDSSTCMRVLKHGHPIINYSLSYRSRNANVGNTIHSVFPLFRNGRIIGTICFVKDYNILERSIPSFLSPKNNEKFAEGTRYTFASIIGSDPAFVDAVKMAKMAGNSPSPVMLYGETGTGKELFAQAIHNFYYSNQKNYIDINCAAIPENLIEGLLFGTTKGAYTGAVDRAGLFEQANGGTIFLDEIDSMPLPLQSKLLRVLQEMKIRRVGSLETVNLNVKIISSMNRPPKELVNSGEFRMDLFYRLAVIYIKIPALRDRLVDIEELGRHFLQKSNRILGKNLENISPQVINFFWNYAWPGNVRELEHVIESAVNMAGENEKTLQLQHCYFADLMGNCYAGKATEISKRQAVPVKNLQYEHPEPIDFNLAENQKRLEKNLIVKALETTKGNIARAADLLGLSRQLLGYKINKYALRNHILKIKIATKPEIM